MADPPPPQENTSADSPVLSGRLVLGAALLVGSFAVITILSHSFVFGEGHETRPIFEFTAVYLLAWLGFGLAISHIDLKQPRSAFTFVIAVAVVLRLLMCFSNPILESDFYRYIWDGEVLESGRNPFAQAPETVDARDIEPAPEQLDAATLVQSRINHPDVKTIYPPVAQLVFLGNAALFSWYPYGFRYSLLIFDLLLLVLVVALTRRLGLPPLSVLLYAWNPLVLKEATNAMHIDMACAFFIGLFLWSLWRNQHGRAFVWLFFATYIKLTPAALGPLYVVYLLKSGRVKAAIWGSVGFGLASVLAVGSLFINADDPLAGLHAFSTQWQSNASLFAVTEGLFGTLAEPDTATRYTRHLMALICVFAYGWALWRVDSPASLTRLGALTLTVIFLVGPVGNPWYLLWLTPFFAVWRCWPLFVLMAMTSLYYINFYILYHDLAASAFDVLRAVEYLPFYLFAGVYIYRHSHCGLDGALHGQIDPKNPPTTAP